MPATLDDEYSDGCDVNAMHFKHGWITELSSQTPNHYTRTGVDQLNQG
jgi:hypothetical protein